jgi:DNA-binding PadR family transcriptional regulator
MNAPEKPAPAADPQSAQPFPGKLFSFRYNLERYIESCHSRRMPARPALPDPGRFLPLPAATFHILVALADRDRHGYSILQDVAARTGGALRLSPGTLYGTMKRLLDDGLIAELRQAPDPDDDDERRRYYRLTPFGRAVASAEAGRLTQLLSQARATGLVPTRPRP